MVFLIKTDPIKRQSNADSMKTLHYILASNKTPITLDLYEAERYEPAVVVQQLIGNLVYYSNNGRYEPRISESWQRVSSTQWDFKIKKGFTCENGEEITPSSFRNSLIRSIKAAAKNGGVPVFNKLKGFNDLIGNKTSDFQGIIANDNTISFHFSEPTRSGPLQILSFAPFGYICEENLNPDLSWKDKSKFVSSGAYKVEKIEIGKEYALVKRKEWPGFAPGSPDKIIISHVLPNKENEVQANTIIDSPKEENSIPTNLTHYPLVPEYLSAILLGNIKNGFFSHLENRQALDLAIQEVKKKNINKKSNIVTSSFFYPSQQRTKPFISPRKVNAPIRPIVIEGKEPDLNNTKHAAFEILVAAFDLLQWKYKLNNNENSWKDAIDPNYDIRIRNPSIGSGVEAWGIDVIFFSPIGINLPDPSGRVKKMLVEYEHDKLTDQELTDQFNTVVEEDAAILPIGHFGVQWYIKGINAKSISPLISIIRFDQVEIE